MQRLEEVAPRAEASWCRNCCARTTNRLEIVKNILQYVGFDHPWRTTDGLLILHAIAATAPPFSPRSAAAAPRRRTTAGAKLPAGAAPAPRTDYDWTSGAPTDAACWPSVSVVTITRDRADFLAEALVSMARQDYPRERVEIPWPTTAPANRSITCATSRTRRASASAPSATPASRVPLENL